MRCDFGVEAAAWPLLQGSMQEATAASYAETAAPPGLRRMSCSPVSSACTWWPDLHPNSP